MSDLLRNEPQDRFVDMKKFEVDGRDTVLPGEHCGNHVVAYQTKLYKIESQSTAVLALIVESLPQMLGANKILADEDFA